MRTLRIPARGVCAHCVYLIVERKRDIGDERLKQEERKREETEELELVAGHTLIAVDGHGAVSEIVGGSGCEWTVDWYLVIVGSESVAMGVHVGE